MKIEKVERAKTTVFLRLDLKEMAVLRSGLCYGLDFGYWGEDVEATARDLKPQFDAIVDGINE